MACQVPGCNTKYWDKTKRLSMFAASCPKNLLKWQEILYDKFGIEDFDKDSRICILHFAEEAIERKRTIYMRGGLSREETMNKPHLAFGAVPTIFTSNTVPNNKNNNKKKKFDYAVTIDNPEILKKQKELFEENRKQFQTPEQLNKEKEILERSRKRNAEIEHLIKQKKLLKESRKKIPNSQEDEILNNQEELLENKKSRVKLSTKRKHEIFTEQRKLFQKKIVNFQASNKHEKIYPKNKQNSACLKNSNKQKESFEEESQEKILEPVYIEYLDEQNELQVECPEEIVNPDNCNQQDEFPQNCMNIESESIVSEDVTITKEKETEFVYKTIVCTKNNEENVSPYVIKMWMPLAP